MKKLFLFVACLSIALGVGVYYMVKKGSHRAEDERAAEFVKDLGN